MTIKHEKKKKESLPFKDIEYSLMSHNDIMLSVWI